MGLQVFDILS